MTLLTGDLSDRLLCIVRASAMTGEMAVMAVRGTSKLKIRVGGWSSVLAAKTNTLWPLRILVLVSFAFLYWRKELTA